MLAAPGLVALQQTPALLPLDHKNARMLAEGEPSAQFLLPWPSICVVQVLCCAMHLLFDVHGFG